MPPNFGKIALLGSGETAPSGKKILRRIMQQERKKYKVAILETPAGFQPNTEYVAGEIKNIFDFSLKEFIASVSVIPARNKKGILSPNNKNILEPLLTADFIFMGPGSPTYTVRQLKGSLALKFIHSIWKNGKTLCLSSAGALAAGKFTLPVYEIYKAGFNLYWEDGLDIFRETGFTNTTIITHWNNKEGGKHLDTRYCYMGKERFTRLKEILPSEALIIGIDEHSALLIDFPNRKLSVEGLGKVTLFYNGSSNKIVIEHGQTLEIGSILNTNNSKNRLFQT